MDDARGMGEALDWALQHSPETRCVTVGSAVKAMVLPGLGCVHQQLDLVPLVCQNQPTPRLIAPGIAAQHRHDATLGRALDTLDAAGVTALYRLMAAMAVQRVGLTPPCAPLESPSCHVDGRSNSHEEPDAPVMHMTRGYSREPRPDLNHVRLALLVAHHAGMPVLMKPRSGHTREARDGGPVVTAPLRQLQTTSRTTYLVADRALYRAENLQPRADTGTTGLPRVPATLTAAQTTLAQAIPAAMWPLRDGDRDQAHTRTYGRVPQRWVLISSAPRRPPAQRTVDTPWLKQREAEGTACQQWCHTTFACEAEAQHARATLTHGLSTTALHAYHMRPTPRDRRGGRPG
jgi:transposase